MRCLATLKAARPDELIVVDDGSRDGSAEAIRAAHPQATLVVRIPARGFSAAANAGLAVAKGDVLWLVNSDTEVPPEAAELLRRAFSGRPRLGVLSPQLVNPDGTPQWTGGRFPRLIWLFALGSGLPAWLARRSGGGAARAANDRVEWVSGAAMAIRAEALRQAGTLDEGFGFYGQDLDLCWRLAEHGWEVGVLSELRVLHHGGATIGRRAGALGGMHPELLYLDLARCVAQRRGPSAGRRAALALRAGNRLRLLLRALVRPFVADESREDFARDSRALEAAQAALGVPPGTE